MLAPTYSANGFLGNVREMRERPLDFLLAVQKTCGGVARFRLGPYLAHLVTDPEAVKYVLVDNYKNFDRNMRQFDTIGLALGRGLLTSSGDFWLRQRRLAQPAFHRQRIAGLADQMSQIAHATLESWETHSREGSVFDLAHFMFEISFEVILRTIFATQLPVPKAEIGRAIEEMIAFVDRAMTAAVTLPLSVPTPGNRRFIKARAVIDGLTRELIAQRHEQHETSSDLLSFLMEMTDEETGQAMSDAQLLDEVKSILLAGHETVANGLTWTFYLLATHPEIMEELTNEARRVLGGRRATLEDCARLPTVTKVVKEALRLYPPGWLIGRNTATKDVVGGFEITARSMMFVVPYVTHRLSEYWPEPERFMPERFAPGEEERRPKYAYLPFGGGPHLCIGQGFAMLEMQLIVATIAQHYRVTLEPGHAVVANPRITLGAKHGVKVRVQRDA